MSKNLEETIKNHMQFFSSRPVLLFHNILITLNCLLIRTHEAYIYLKFKQKPLINTITMQF